MIVPTFPRCECAECGGCPNVATCRVTRDYGDRIFACDSCTFSSDTGKRYRPGFGPNATTDESE